MITGFQRNGFQDTAFQVPDIPAFQTSGFQQDAFQELPGISGNVTVFVTGVSATGAIGSVTVTGGAVVQLTGVSATAAIGTVTVNTAGDVTVIVTGVQATAAIGTVTVAIITGVTVLATGVQAIGAIGTVTVSTGQPTAQGGGGGKRPFIYEEAIDVPTKIVIRVNSEVAVRGVSSKIRVGWAQVAATQSVTAEARSVLAVARLSVVEACEVQNCLVEAGAVYGTTRASRAYVKSIQNLSDDALMLLLLAI